MALKLRDERASFEKLARKLYFSRDSIDWFIEHASVSQLHMVNELIAFEGAVRARRRKERMFRKAAFPQVKTFEGYDFSKVEFPDGYTAKDLMSLEFLDSAQDFVFHGQTGRGKTHLAIAVGVAAINAGKTVRFFTAASLVMLLLKAVNEDRLERTLSDIDKADLVILDEFGYIPIDIDGARLLFQVISNCYERRSMIITTNIEFSKWGTVLSDEKLASAAMDRIIHHGRLVEFGGESKRMESSLMLEGIK